MAVASRQAMPSPAAVRAPRQRKCSCGTSSLGNECGSCKAKRRQRRAFGGRDDGALEAAADRAALALSERKESASRPTRSEASTAAFAGSDFTSVRLRQPSYSLDVESPDTGATELEEGGAKGGGTQGGASKSTPSCGETVTWVPNSPVPTDITADSAVEFAGKIDSALAGNPHTNASFSFNSDIQAGKMVAVNMTLESSIIRPRWSGGRATATEQALIKRVETFIKEHEERHRDISRDVGQTAVCDAKGKAVAQATAVLKKAICDTEPTKQEELDNKEGKLTWVKDSTGAVTDFASAAEKHDYHVKGCDPFGTAAPKGGSKSSEGSGE